MESDWSKSLSEKVDLFFQTEYSKPNFVFHLFKAIFKIPVSGLRGRYSVNGTTKLIWTNGKHDSGTNSSGSECCKRCPSRGPTGLPK